MAAALAAVMVLVCAPAGAACADDDTETVAEEQETVAALVARSETAEKTDQIVVVINKVLCLYERDGGTWRRVFRTKARVGRGGFSTFKTRVEHDGTTPVGAYKLPYAFGTGRQLGGMKFKKITKYSYFVSNINSKYYNRWRESRKKVRGEHLIEYRCYRYAFVIDFNHSQTPRKGSCIFLHCFSGLKTTGGCVAISAKRMKQLHKRLDDGAYIIIVRKKEDLKKY
jgi:L,D-peptidoglycan transpeptidase YkuD (ErfK/YbiS/YcfS/YnhG family)